mmetsp:Transcript_21626/g.48947  ORF Transcript_21626/g.48947 Transcript_21626/m.48947 type:complete len:430 (+) Transcript_21626:1964-3253(+)
MRRRKCRRVSSTIFRLRSTLHSHIDFICTCHTYDDGFPSCLCFSYSSSTKIYTAAPFSFSVPSTPLSALDEDGFIELASDAALPNSFFTCANNVDLESVPGSGCVQDRGGHRQGRARCLRNAPLLLGRRRTPAVEPGVPHVVDRIRHRARVIGELREGVAELVRAVGHARIVRPAPGRRGEVGHVPKGRASQTHEGRDGVGVVPAGLLPARGGGGAVGGGLLLHVRRRIRVHGARVYAGKVDLGLGGGVRRGAPGRVGLLLPHHLLPPPLLLPTPAAAWRLRLLLPLLSRARGVLVLELVELHEHPVRVLELQLEAHLLRGRDGVVDRRLAVRVHRRPRERLVEPRGVDRQAAASVVRERAQGAGRVERRVDHPDAPAAVGRHRHGEVHRREVRVAAPPRPAPVAAVHLADGRVVVPSKSGVGVHGHVA